MVVAAFQQVKGIPQFLDTETQGRIPYRGEKDLELALAEDADGIKSRDISEESTRRIRSDPLKPSGPWLDKSIVERARKHLDMSVPIQGKLGRWDDWFTEMRNAANSLETPFDALRYAQMKVPFYHRDTELLNWEFMKKLDGMLVTEFPWLGQEQGRLCDEPLSPPETLYFYEGKRQVSSIFYWHMRSLFCCLTHVPARDIIEIGGGFGALARLWLNQRTIPVQKYTIIDLPVSLFFAECYLTALFGDRVGYYPDDKPILLVPVGAEYQSKADLAINVGSLQEMNEQWVSYWMNWLDKANIKYFYSLNYAGGAVQCLYESRNWWSCPLSALWKAIVVNADPPLVRMLSLNRDFYESLYKRGGEKVPFNSWSVLHGSALTRQTYFEGLELLRQDSFEKNIEIFLERVLGNRNPTGRILVNKELLYLATLLADRNNRVGIRARDFINSVSMRSNV